MPISFLERTHSDLEHTSPGPCDFTVHRYALRTLAQSELLSLGAKLIHSSSSKASGWVNVRAHIISSDSGGTKNVYQLAVLPPTIEKDKYLPVEDLKEWGVNPETSEIFCLTDLENFTSTDLVYLTNLEAASTSLKRKASSMMIPAVPQEPPRKSLKLDDGPLHKVIPYPHMHPSKQTKLAYPSTKVPVYRRTKPIPIPPHTDPLPAPIEHACNAWIIPVRGVLPFDFCTRAAVFDSTHPLSLPSPPTPNVENKITWTRPALIAFWTYLLRLRDAGSLGALGVSFHAAPSHRHGTSSIVSSAGATDEIEVETESGPSLSPLSVLDHIKVYHDAPSAMHVRNALDVWAYIVPGQEHKIRVLKHARLVLVDERAKGVLIS